MYAYMFIVCVFNRNSVIRPQLFLAIFERQPVGCRSCDYHMTTSVMCIIGVGMATGRETVS